MGPPFVRWNDASERHDILYFEKSVQQLFSEAWKLHQTGEVANVEPKPMKNNAEDLAKVTPSEAPVAAAASVDTGNSAIKRGASIWNGMGVGG